MVSSRSAAARWGGYATILGSGLLGVGGNATTGCADGHLKGRQGPRRPRRAATYGAVFEQQLGVFFVQPGARLVSSDFAWAPCGAKNNPELLVESSPGWTPALW